MEVTKKAKTREAENQIRDLLNWIAVFDEEYSLPPEVTSTLQKGLLSLAKKISKL